MAFFNLDDPVIYQDVDHSNMLSELVGLPDQLLDAWKLGFEYEVPKLNDISHLVIAGMGGSAIGADLLSAFCSDITSCPVFVLREYELPTWANGKNALVIASSHSGNTEEVLSVFDQAIERDCSLMVLSTGGILAQKAAERAIPLWQFTHNGQPRSAVGFSFGLLLALVTRLNLISDPNKSVKLAIDAMRQMIQSINIDMPVKRNQAKRIAGQLVDRWVTIVAADYLTPLARRYKTQINELAKAWAQFEFLPEMDHNTLAGIFTAEEVLAKNFVLFLSASHNHPRNILRIEHTRTEFMQAGINTDVIDFRQDDKLAEMWSCLVFGDFLAYYLAIAYHIDPTPIEAIQALKNKMK